MPIRTTPKQRQENCQVRRLNQSVSRGGRTLKKSKALDKKWNTTNSSDTRRVTQNLCDAMWQRDKLAAELKGRIKSLRSSPSQKEHAQKLLRQIDRARSNERKGRITGRTASLTKRQRNTNRNGVIRLKTF